MGIRDKIDAYKKERAKLKAIEKSAYTGQKAKEKQRKELEKQKKAVQRAEKAAEKGISKAKAGGTWGMVSAAAKKEAANWNLGDGKVEPIVKSGKKSTTKRKTTTDKKTKTGPPQTKMFGRERYKLAGRTKTKSSAETIKQKEKKIGKKARIVKSSKYQYLIYSRK